MEKEILMSKSKVLSKEFFLQPKSLWQHIYDFLGSPLRMILLPDKVSRKLGLTSLQDERIRAVIHLVNGKLLDIGAGDNLLLNIYGDGTGVDVFDFGGGATIVEDTRQLPFEDESFETVTFLACLNHIPYRQEVLTEAFRLLKPGGKVIATMISPLLGTIGHKIWWYSEEKHRGMADGEEMGISREEMFRLLENAGFTNIREQSFLYNMNHLYHGTK
jgi:SAM-dependent methyltransferase